MADQATRLRQIVGDRIVSRQAANGDDGARVIAVTSGKGGVGKTNITVNLAIALHAMGKRVLVIDADLGMANVDVLLGTRSRGHLLKLLDDGVSLADVLTHADCGIDYIAGGSGIEKAISLSEFDKKRLLEKLVGIDSIADIILIDTGAGLGHNVMDFILSAGEVLLVTTPEPTALTDAYAVLKAYSMYSDSPDIRLIVNRVYEEEESREVVAKLQQTSARFLSLSVGCLGYIYDDGDVPRSVRSQVPFMVRAPGSLAARCTAAMASNLLYGRTEHVKRGWRGFLQHIFNFSR